MEMEGMVRKRRAMQEGGLMERKNAESEQEGEREEGEAGRGAVPVRA